MCHANTYNWQWSSNPTDFLSGVNLLALLDKWSTVLGLNPTVAVLALDLAFQFVGITIRKWDSVADRRSFVSPAQALLVFTQMQSVNWNMINLLLINFILFLLHFLKIKPVS